MDFLVEMEIILPTDPEVLADLTKRERARAAELATSGNFFKEVWIVPGQRARILICSAADAREFHETFTSLPGFMWSNLQSTPIIECEVGTSICIPN